jgi:hexokinase
MIGLFTKSTKNYLIDDLGCLMSCAWKNPKCRIGLIIGTGTNACYLEVNQYNY